MSKQIDLNDPICAEAAAEILAAAQPGRTRSQHHHRSSQFPHRHRTWLRMRR